MSDDFDPRYVYTTSEDDILQRALAAKLDEVFWGKPVNEALLSLAIFASHLAAIHDRAAGEYVGLDVLLELHTTAMQMLLHRRREAKLAEQDPRRCPDCGQIHENENDPTPGLKGGE